MRPLRAISAWALATMLAGCASEPTPSESALSESALSESAPSEPAPALRAMGPAAEGPPGSDGMPRVRVAWGDGAPLDREAIAFVPRWGAGAALVDPERRLYEVRPDGARRMIARDATGALAVDDAELAYVVERGGFAALHVTEADRDDAIAEGFASIGALRFLGPGELAFVGARPGGVAGIWHVIAGSTPRCVSNCALRTGAPLDGLVPLPLDASSIVRTGDALEWTASDGAIVRGSLR
ncbi:MAG: hypothetical protein AB7S26_02655 [Sandaracinaceae bacterium]